MVDVLKLIGNYGYQLRDIIMIRLIKNKGLDGIYATTNEVTEEGLKIIQFAITEYQNNTKNYEGVKVYLKDGKVIQFNATDRITKFVNILKEGLIR